jgi:hypothetical protein
VIADLGALSYPQDPLRAVRALAEVQRRLPFETMMKRRDGLLAEANSAPTPLTPLVDWCLLGPAGEVLPGLLAEIGADDQ